MDIKKIGSLWRCHYNGTDFIAPTREELMKIIFNAKRIDNERTIS